MLYFFPFYAEKENLCLYGFPDEAWEVNLPAEEVPPELPEPALGINFARDGMQRKDWISLVAVHSDAWLVSVAFYFGARFDKNDRLVIMFCLSSFGKVLLIFIHFIQYSFLLIDWCCFWKLCCYLFVYYLIVSMLELMWNGVLIM